MLPMPVTVYHNDQIIKDKDLAPLSFSDLPLGVQRFGDARERLDTRNRWRKTCPPATEGMAIWIEQKDRCPFSESKNLAEEFPQSDVVLGQTVSTHNPCIAFVQALARLGPNLGEFHRHLLFRNRRNNGWWPDFIVMPENGAHVLMDL